MSVRNEFSDYGWVPSDSMTTFSWQFLFRSVLVLVSSAVSSLSDWVESTTGNTMALISLSDTSCIVSSLLVCPARSGVMTDLVGKFLVDSTYSESPTLLPKQTDNEKSLLGLADNLGDTA